MHGRHLHDRSDVYPGSVLYRERYLHAGIRVHPRPLLHDGAMLYRWTDVYDRCLVHVGRQLHRWPRRVYDRRPLHVPRVHRLHELHPG